MGQWSPYIRRFEAKYNLPPGLLGQVMRQESGGQAHVVSPAGAIGLMQLMPGTAQGLGVDPHDPIQNLEGGAKYLSQQLKAFGGSVPKALAAYNAGPGAVRQYNGVPPYKETQNYVKRITSEWNRVRPSRHTGTASSFNNSRPSRDYSKQLGSVNASLRGAEDALSALNSWGIGDSNYFGEQSARLGGKISRLSGEASQLQQLQSQAQARPEVQQSQANPYSTPPGGKSFGGRLPDRKPSEFGYQYLQRLGRNLFGLENDPGNNQTTGGRHTSDSWHYKNAAVDFGNARNTPQQLNQWYGFLNQNKNRLGLVELLNEDPGTGNWHIHAAMQ